MTTGWLIFIAIVLIVVVLFQVTRTLDLVSQLRGGEHTSEEMTRFHATLGIIFLVLGLFGFFWCFPHFKDRLVGPSASEHGVLIERMFNITLWICSIVFLVCNILLFTFAYMFRYRKNRQSVHFAHSNKLEFIWTIVPTIVLTGLVVFGLQAWTKITSRPTDASLTIEVTGQQFYWTSRYPGPDGKLGLRDNDLICPENPLGIVTVEFVEHRLHALTDSLPLPVQQWGEIPKLWHRYNVELPPMMDSLNNIILHSPDKYIVAEAKKKLDDLEDEYDDIPTHIKRRVENVQRIKAKYTDDFYQTHREEMTWGYDDIMPSELHLPVDKQVFVKIEALDVLHDFYIPMMKVKMDAVPGMPTSFKFTPTVTTEEKRKMLSQNPEWQGPSDPNDPTDKTPRWQKFQYEVACAELCGVGHSNMKYTLVVDDQRGFDQWLAQQPSKWSQVKDQLRLDHGFSEFAPKDTGMNSDTAMMDMDMHGTRQSLLDSIKNMPKNTGRY